MSTTGKGPDIPVLEGEAAAAVAHCGGHVQIIAAAGSGKTEVVSQRVAELLVGGEDPSSIVAFTFTEKAAEELKERIRLRVVARLGDSGTDKLGQLFVGTIHAFCFRLLQTYVPKYETYTPLDSNQLVNLLYREGTRLGLKALDPNGRLFRAVNAFQRSVDVIENELLGFSDIPAGEFRTTLSKYYNMLDDYRFMSFGTQIVRAVEALDDPQTHARVTKDLRHLIVDEYQDVNPAQERLIELLAKPHGQADLVVVGDDDQAIYQWRGSNVDNIVTFEKRYPEVTQFHLLTNRRSRRPIVDLANAFARSITDRLDKQMRAHRSANGVSIAIQEDHRDEEAEAQAIATDIAALHSSGVTYRDIAILVRGKVAYPKIRQALDARGIPVQPGGRSGLFLQPEAAALGATYAWLGDIEWQARPFGEIEDVDIDLLIAKYRSAFGVNATAIRKVRAFLEDWKRRTAVTDHGVSLMKDLYDLLALLGVASWSTSDPVNRNRLGTIGRFSNVLADYETAFRRARRDNSRPGEQVGGRPGDPWFYKNLGILLKNYVTGNYDDFGGEEDLVAGGVALGTVHGAKGLEWPIVFLPSLTDGRFPSSRTGQAQSWLIPRRLFDAARYEGSDADERRLFYVALTRSRDWVSLSSHSKVDTGKRDPSPYLLDCLRHVHSTGRPSTVDPVGIEIPDLHVTYSALASYRNCPHSYLLRSELGMMPPIQQELGYGNAVHHLMRAIAEQTQASGQVPSPSQIDSMLNRDFFLPFANKPAHRQMRAKARQLVDTYVRDHRDDLLRTWATERPFELYLPGVVVSGRADVIYDMNDGVPENLVIVDYKTSTGGVVEPLQLQVYADAGRREGLTVSAAYIHDMSTTHRHQVPIGQRDVLIAETEVARTAEALKQRDFTPAPAVDKCRICDIRKICGSARLN